MFGLRLGGMGLIPRRSGASWTPLTLFLAGEQGGWYDPTDLTTMFQDSAGTTPVTAVEQPVGLWLDKRLGALSAQQYDPATVPTASFDGNGAVTVARSGASLTFTSAANGDGIRLNGFNAAAGDVFTYVEFTASGSGTLAVFAGNVQTTFTLTASPTTYRATTCPNIAGFATPIFRALSAGFNAQITITSIRALRGNHLIQPTSASRPTYSKRYNLLERTQEFDNAAWVKNAGSVSANAATAPDGTSTADKLVENTANTTHEAKQDVTTTAVSHTFSVFLKAAERTFAMLYHGNTNSAQVINLTTGAAAGNAGLGSPVSSAIENSGNGWWKVSITVNATAAVNNFRVYPLTNSTTYNYTGDGVSGILIWGADLRRTIHTTMGMPAYQRVTTATDYDESGFLPRLRFDGADDSMYSAASVNFSATDEMTVLAGLTKLSDVTQAIVAELSANSGSTAGAIALASANLTTGSYAGYSARSNGSTSVTVLSAATHPSPDTAVATVLSSVSPASLDIRINGTSEGSSSSSQGTGNFGNHVLFAGRRNNASLPFNGDIFQLIVRGALTSGADLTSAEQYVAARTGVTLP